jgi:hypothetical protein
MNFLLIAIGQILLGCRLVRAGFSREAREARMDDEPVRRSDGTDRVVQLACFVLGPLFIVVGLFMLVMLILERQH